MYMHITWYRTRFSCLDVAPLDLFSLSLQMNSCPAIKSNVMSCPLARISIPSAEWSLKEVKHLVVQPELPSALCFLGHDCTWQLRDTQPRCPLSHRAEGMACGFILSLLGMFCLAVEICSWCSIGQSSSPKHAVWCCHMTNHSRHPQTLKCPKSHHMEPALSPMPALVARPPQLPLCHHPSSPVIIWNLRFQAPCL